MDLLRISDQETLTSRLRDRRSSGCMPAWGRSMSRRRTSRIASRRRNSSLRAATHSGARRRGPGASRAPRCEGCDERSATVAPPSNCCTASRIRQRAQHEERGAVHRPRDMLPRAGRIRPRPCARSGQRALSGALIRNCSATAGASFLRWSPRGVGSVDQFPNGHEQARLVEPSTRVRRGRRSTS